ncbi:hypothetical protein D3C81_1373510 [compost metagenome]
MIVDKKQTIASENQVKTDISVEYFRTKEKNGDLFTCVIRLSNGFQAVGSVERTYRATLSDADAESLARQRAVNFVHMHGYTLV